MKKNSKISNFLSFLDLTKIEKIFILLIITGLVLGSLYKIFIYRTDNSFSNISEEVFRLNDSLALAQQTTYIGTDAEGDTFEDLKKVDTIVKKNQEYPQSIKKELPFSKININNSSKVELMKLPGIGEKTALKIIDFRKTRKFSKIEDIMLIKGIGKKKFEKMKQFIDVK
jgi:competence ComEA-like helix-hairpin-helix protein